MAWKPLSIPLMADNSDSSRPLPENIIRILTTSESKSARDAGTIRTNADIGGLQIVDADMLDAEVVVSPINRLMRRLFREQNATGRELFTSVARQRSINRTVELRGLGG
jgi:hypothetical protein